jgi:hypothetical protein
MIAKVVVALAGVPTLELPPSMKNPKPILYVQNSSRRVYHDWGDDDLDIKVIGHIEFRLLYPLQSSQEVQQTENIS